MSNEQLRKNSQPDELTPVQKGYLELAAGAKVLSDSGFESRHKEIVDSSFNKARKKGEKQIGTTASVRRNATYLSRLQNLIEKNGDDIEKRLWNQSLDNLIIKPKNIPESFWHQQKQAHRDKGYGNHNIDSREKQMAINEIQTEQQKSLNTWSSYLGDQNTHYPIWFKVYAWDGMSKMGEFSKEIMRFTKRDKGTVAPYPECNKEVLAKVFDIVNKKYHSGNTTENYDAQTKDLLKLNNFNELYSRILLSRKSILKTPERTEDVRGAWVEYSPGEEQQLAEAATGTGWCIASTSRAKIYLGSPEHKRHNNEYVKSQQKQNAQGNTNNEPDNKARFYLFHLYDPEKNVLSETACASIRLDKDGNVDEISGIKNKSQDVEDSLVPIVEEKALSLPGGEDYLEAFADTKELTRLDRKMQKDEPLTKEEYEFVYEINRKIKSLNKHSEDPRIGELREKYDLGPYLTMGGVNSDELAHALAKSNRLEIIINNIDKFVATGANIDPTALANRLIESGDKNTIVHNIDKFVNAGADIDPTALAESLIENGDRLEVDFNLDKFINAGADPTALANSFIENGDENAIARNIYTFVNAGVDIDPTALANKLIENGDGRIVAYKLGQFLDAGADIDPTALANKFIEDENEITDPIAYNIDQFLKAGADIDPTALANKLIEDQNKGQLIIKNFDKFVNAGVNPTTLANKLIENGDGGIVAYNLGQFLDAGADIDPTALATSFIENGDEDSVARNIDKFLNFGANPTTLANSLIEKGREDFVAENIDKFVNAGANINPTALANKLIERGDGYLVAYHYETFIDAGVDPTTLASALIKDGNEDFVANNLDRFLDAGVDPTDLCKNLIKNGDGKSVADNIDRFVNAGANRQELESMLENS